MAPSPLPLLPFLPVLCQGTAPPACPTADRRPLQRASAPVLLQTAARRSATHLAPPPPACGSSTRVNGSSAVARRCPSSCPFYAEDPHAPCSFACVAECAHFNPATPVPDATTGACLACHVRGCRSCVRADSCKECEEGLVLRQGHCFGRTQGAWACAYVALGVAGLIATTWTVDLLRRPVTNHFGLQRGLRYRERCKLRKAAGRGGMHMEPWALSTNLCKEDVGGVGLMLFFSFQAAVVVWGLGVLLAWVALALLTSKELLTLGLRQVDTMRDYCIVAQWGYRSQQELARVKELFVGAVYAFSSMAVLFYSYWAHRLLAVTDDGESTMKDFTALLQDLPALPGGEKWEERLAQMLGESTGQEVVGVSICWDYGKCEGPILAEIQRLERRREIFCRSASMQQLDEAVEQRDDADAEPSGWLSRAFYRAESRLLQGIVEIGEEAPREVLGLLTELRAGHSAYVVFRSERARDRAVEAVGGLGGLDFQGRRLRLSPVRCEPTSVLFKNACFRWRERVHRLVVGLLVIAFAQALWTVAFYMPYAHYMLAFTSAQGVEPGFMGVFSFSLIVAVGNQIMYYVCREVAERVGFVLQGQLEACYIVLYSGAVLFNVVVDLAVGYRLAYVRMVAAGIRTHDGKLLDHVESSREIFESYIMQKDLGSQLLSYFFPATVLVPFIMEPFFLYVLPLQLLKGLASRHAELTRHQVEDLFRASPMDLGRYADLLINVLLGVLVFLFPGGFTMPVFIILVLCHCYIYGYDHYRVLRIVPTFCLSTDVVVNWTTALLAVPCGILLSTVVLKTNCRPGFPCVPDTQLYARCAAAFLLHLLLHLALLFLVLPRFFRVHREASEAPYEDTAKLLASSWFTANPVHCLRSKYLYGHEPPCDFYSPGKEHLLRVNPKIGQFFHVDFAS